MVAQKKPIAKKPAAKKSAVKKSAAKKPAAKKPDTEESATPTAKEEPVAEGLAEFTEGPGGDTAATKLTQPEWIRRHPAPEHALPIASLVQTGFCLWVGAGLGIQLGLSRSIKVPSWTGLVASLESQLGIQYPPSAEIDFPDRLQVVLRMMGRDAFQRALRLQCAVPTARALVELIEDWAETDNIPQILGRIIDIGALASSVVNFNIESCSSRVLCSSSTFKIKAFHPPTEGTSGFRSYPTVTSNHSGEPPLNILHPHGAIDISGRSVLTSDEYRSLDGTLSLQLATHHAFMEDLVILGMSLADKYLREQLVKFRGQIKRIFWVRWERESGDALSAWPR